MLLLSEFPDLKHWKLLDESQSFAIAETRTFTYTFPPDRVSVIDCIEFAPGTLQNPKVTSLMIDGAEQIGEDFGVYDVTRPWVWNQQLGRFSQKPAVTGVVLGPISAMEIPARYSVQVTVLNGAVADSNRVRIWAYVHQDRDKEYQTVAARQ